MQKTIADISLTYLKGVGPARAELLEKELGIKTVGDMVTFFPFRYIDRTRFYKISELENTSSEFQIVGKIVDLKTEGANRKARLKAIFADETDKMELVWFKGIQWIKRSLQLHQPYVVFGKITQYKGVFSISHPEIELLADYKNNLQSAMQPVYHSTEGLLKKGVTNRVMQTIIQNLFIEYRGKFSETLSADILAKHHLLDKNTALFQLHFPESQQLLFKAEQRMKFEELFFIQLQLILNNIVRKQKVKGVVFDEVGHFFNTFYSDYLPFDLTNAQKKVIKDIRKDTRSGTQMNRLLQGDVGSGKTIVALMSALIALDNGYQVAIMAPTEILAIQHYDSICGLLKQMSVKVELLTGQTPQNVRKNIHQGLESGDIHILIGTHALIEDKVKFKNLGYVVIDEQHRFGVAQRAKMYAKNTMPPHILVMTATPIPRTLAMTLYGDLDVSIIDELPPGRKPVKTVLRFESQRLKVFSFLREEILKGRQVYIVYPLIEESKTLDYNDLSAGFESISRAFPLPSYRISIVHGRMNAKDKETEMQQFAKGETQILVATTVIEVGVNVPNATVMIIENAEKFGLSQLHQLRGRVGRGGAQSYCILMAGQKMSNDAKKRLDIMVQTTDGFKIAEADLKLRGPGNIMSTQQSGVLNLKIANLVQDSDLLKLARFAAFDLLKEDPQLLMPKNSLIKQSYFKMSKRMGDLSNIS